MKQLRNLASFRQKSPLSRPRFQDGVTYLKSKRISAAIIDLYPPNSANKWLQEGPKIDEKIICL